MKIEKTTLEEILTRVDAQAAVKAPELITPEEGKGYKLPRGRGADILPSMDMMSDGKTPISSRASEADGTLDHAIAVATAGRKGKPVNASAVDTYGIKLPYGYIREGDLYVFKPKPAIKKGATDAESNEG